MAIYLLDVFEYSASIVNKTDSFLISIFDSVNLIIKRQEISLETLSFISNDISYLSSMVKYFIGTIEELTGMSLKKEMSFFEYYQKLM